MYGGNAAAPLSTFTLYLVAFLTHLNDISILYDCSQQFAVFRLILLLFQVSGMLTENKGQRCMKYNHLSTANRFATRLYSI